MKDLIVIFPFRNNRADIELCKHALSMRKYYWDTIISTQHFFEEVAKKYLLGQEATEKKAGFELIIHEPDEIVSTYRIAEYAVGIAGGGGSTRITAIATPQHIGRCVSNLKKIAEKSMDPDMIVVGSYPPFSSDYFYEEHSEKISARSPLLWWPAEAIKRTLSHVLPFRAYSIIAS